MSEFSFRRHLSNLLGPIEPGLAMGSGALGSMYGGLAGIGHALTGGNPKQASNTVKKVQNAMAYRPRTPSGQKLTQQLGSGIERAGEAITDQVPLLSGQNRGEATLGLTGSPALAAAAETFSPSDLIPGPGTAAKLAPAMFLGLKGAKSLAGGGDLSVLDAFEVAKKMEQRGLDPQSIWDATAEHFRRQGKPWAGVYRGDDAKQRFEVPDDMALFQDLNDHPSMDSALGDVLYHEDLFKAMPDLEEMKVSLRNDPEQGHLGSYNPSFDEIGVNTSTQKYDPNDSPHQTLLHEVQHAIQQREGFQGGGNMDMFRVGNEEGMKEGLGMIQTEIDQLLAGGKSSPEIDALQGNLNEISVNMTDPSYAKKSYMRLPGEAEARAVEKRWGKYADSPRRPHPFRDTDYTQAQRRHVFSWDDKWDQLMDSYRAVFNKVGPDVEIGDGGR